MIDYERVAFGCLLDVHPAPLSRSELAAQLGNPVLAEDAVGALARDGLVNISGDLSFARRAAVRADELRL